MLAVDTNVVVRYIVRDDASQTARADELFRTERVLILSTVLLETEWVLRYTYGFDRKDVGRVFRALAGLPQVDIEKVAEVARALDWFAAGMDFADALHVACSLGADGFATFDRRLATTTRRLGSGSVQLLR